MNQEYAFIKNNEVVNVVLFDEPSQEELAFFKNEFNLDSIVIANNKTAIGGTYDGEKFWLSQPFPSWTKGESDWEAPVAYPGTDLNNLKEYYWDEETTSWIKHEEFTQN
jgi:hypothetical protein